MTLKWKPKTVLDVLRVFTIYFFGFFGARIVIGHYMLSEDLSESLFASAVRWSVFMALLFLLFSRGGVIKSPFDRTEEHQQPAKE